MSRIVSLGTFIMLCSLMCAMNCKEDQCRQLEFRAALAFRGKRLLNHKIKEVDNVAKDFCGALCFMEPNCVSYNILVSNDSPSITKCEMNNATHFEHPSDLVSFSNSIYRGSKNVCIKEPCPSNAICQAGFSSEGYRCVCVPGYTGEDCTKDVDECDLGEYKCDSNAECINTRGSYDCKCKEGFTGDGLTCKADNCYNYTNLTGSDRKSNYHTPLNGPSRCDNELINIGGWHRFVGDAGTKMPTTRVPAYRCGTDWSGWLDGAHPTVEDGEVPRDVCGSDRSTGCRLKFKIFVKNCGSYFIYKLFEPVICRMRYCGTD